MTRSTHGIAALAGICLMAAIPLHAQDAPTAEEKAEKALAAQSALLAAQTTNTNANKAYVDSLVAALGITAPKGQTTIDATTGKFEGAMLASGAVNAAAVGIRDAISANLTAHDALVVAQAGTPPPTTVKPIVMPSILLLGRNDTLDLAAASVLPREMGAIDTASSALIDELNCPGPVKDEGANFIQGIAPLVGAALNLLRTDTDVTGFSLTIGDDALIDALIGEGAPAGRVFVVPGELVVLDPSSEVVISFDKLLADREQIRGCRAVIAALAEGDDKAKAAAAPGLARLDAMIKRVEDYVEHVTMPGEKSPSPLTKAVTASALLTRPNMTVLRVNVEGAGGSLLKRSNLWTMLGAPAIGITGGLMVHWRLVDPTDGTAIGGGKLVCSTQLTNLRAVQEGKIGSAWCGNSVQKNAPENQPKAAQKK